MPKQRNFTKEQKHLIKQCIIDGDIMGLGNQEGEGWGIKMNPIPQINKIFVLWFHLQDDHGFGHIRMIHQIPLNQLIL